MTLILGKTEGRAVVRCAYRQGSGVSPIGARNSRLACRGIGIASIEEPTERCSSCGGTGVRQASGLYCIPCHASGVKSTKR